MGGRQGRACGSGRTVIHSPSQIAPSSEYSWRDSSIRVSCDGGLSSRLGIEPISRYHLFPYREEDKFIDHDGTERKALRPSVDVILARDQFDWRARALIDTGSNLTLFDRGAGEALELDFTSRAAPRRVVRLLGREWDVLGAYVALTLPPFEDLWWETQVWFFLEDWDMPYGILGSEGFLDKWAVSFNRYYNYFVVEPADEFHKDMPVDPFEEFQKLDLDWEPKDY